MSRTVVPWGDVYLVFSDDGAGRRIAIGYERHASRDGLGRYVEVVGQLATTKRDVRRLIGVLRDLGDELPD